MLSIAMLALVTGLMFVYTALHPDKQPIPAGRMLAKRIRIWLLGAIILLSVTVGYQLPVEIGEGLTRLSERQSQQQSEKTERRMAAEQRHVARMIELFGSNDRYLSYLHETNTKKTPF